MTDFDITPDQLHRAVTNAKLRERGRCIALVEDLRDRLLGDGWDAAAAEVEPTLAELANDGALVVPRTVAPIPEGAAEELVIVPEEPAAPAPPPRPVGDGDDFEEAQFLVRTRAARGGFMRD